MDGPDLLVVGDSVAWGQALDHESKFASLVSEELFDSSLPRERIRARSGAPIGLTRDPEQDPISPQTVPNRTARREVPWSRPTILEQLEAIPDDEAEAAELLMVVGSINDIDIETIISPFTDQHGGTGQPTASGDNEDDVDLETYVEQFCYADMLALLGAARERCPNATIVVGGYYPILSYDTGSFEIDASLEELASGLTANVSDDSVQNALYFHLRALYWHRRAVAEFDVDQPPGEPGVCFAPPGFSVANSVAASDPWVYGPDDEDPLRSIREEACEDVFGGSDSSMDTLTCKRAMTGHPNEAGAQAYADAVLDRYDARRNRSVGESIRPLTDADDAPVSYRETLERYGLDAESGARSELEHVVVDCIEATIETGDNSTNSEIVLEIADGHGWVLDSLSDSNDFEDGSVRSYTIDPRLHGQENPLRLEEIERVSIVKDGIADWKLESISLAINGRTVHEETPSVLLEGDDQWTSAYPYV